MKHNKYIMIFLVFSLILTMLGCKNREQSVTNSLENAIKTEENEITEIQDYKLEDVSVDFVNHNDYTSFGIPEECNQLIKEYFTLYYKALGSFENARVDALYANDALYEADIVNAMISYQNGIRERFDVDMQYKKATVGVSYRNAKQLDTGYEIYLAENNYMNFNFIPETTSYTSDVEHIFTFENTSEGYRITKHSEITGVYNLIVDGFESYINDMQDYDISEIFDIVQKHFVNVTDRELKVMLEQRDEYNSSPEKFITNLSADNEYDSQKALEYSYEWAGKTEAKRNPDFGIYDIYGGNCNNFTSQCLFAGGIPMDIQGAQWKWYGEAVNSTGGNYGRSPSWAECDYFYDYCTKNEGYGLVCDTDTNVYSGKPGDLIQYIVDETDAVHTVIITKVIYDNNGNVIDYLINSNTTDKVDCPMSTYGYTNFRLIKIIGWNN